MKVPEGYEAARSSAAAAELPLGKLVFRGPDRQRFLHGLLTNDVLGLAPGAFLRTCVLTPKGKLVADFFLYNRGEDLLALCRPEASAAVVAALSKALPLSKTTIEDAGAAWGAVYVQGPKAAEAVRGAQAYAYPLFSPDGIVVLEAPAALGGLRERLRRLEVRDLSAEALEALRVEAGAAAPGTDYDADAFPLEVGLESAISFTKGCYMGQETIAHIKNRGHLNRRLTGLKLQGRPAAGSPVLAQGQPAGRLGSLVESPRLKAALGLAVLRVEHSAPGTIVDVGGTPAEVVGLPV